MPTKIKQLVENEERFYPLTAAEGVVFQDGSYLSSKQFANNGTLTIQQDGTTIGTFSANASTNSTINITTGSSADSVASAIYNSSTQKIEFYNAAGTHLNTDIDATAFIKDGMVQNVVITTGTGSNAGKSVLKIDFNTDAEGDGHTDIEIPLENIFNPNNYYTKTETDNTFLSKSDYISDEEIVSTALNVLAENVNEVKSYVNEELPDILDNALASKEDKSNKVTSITSSSTDVQYPSAKAVYDSIIASGLKSITYSELSTLKTNGQLDPGKYYRITDYVTTTTYAESRALAHKFDIIVLALDAETLSENAYAIQNATDNYFDNSDLSAWKLNYCIDNDTTRFEWADTTNGKGVIYRMIDEFGNDVPYDFKNIQFKRYKVTPKTDYATMLANLSGMYIGTPTNYSGNTMTGLDYDSSDSQWYFTFNTLTSDMVTPVDASLNQTTGNTCANNTFEPTAQEKARKLNNNVVLGGTAVASYLRDHGGYYGTYTTTDCVNNHFGENANFLTFAGGIANNYIESQFRGNVIVGEFRHNTIGSDVQDNLIFTHNDCSFNEFDSYFSENIIETTIFSLNTIGSNFINNIISATNFRHNVIGSFVKENTIKVERSFEDNHIQDFYNNTITAGAIIANQFLLRTHDNTITIGNELSLNSFDGWIYNNIITIPGSSGNFRFNTISGWFHDNTINPSANNASSTNNIWNGNIYSNTLYQCVNCEFVGQFSACTASCILYGCRFSAANTRLTIPTSSSYFCGIDAKGLAIPSGSTFALDYSEFFALPNNFTPWCIEYNATESTVTARKKEGSAFTGVQKELTGSEWTPIEGVLTDEDGEVISRALNDLNQRIYANASEIEFVNNNLTTEIEKISDTVDDITGSGYINNILFNGTTYAPSSGTHQVNISQTKADWNAASGYGEILNKPTIPTTVAQLTDASNYVQGTKVTSISSSSTDSQIPTAKAVNDVLSSAGNVDAVTLNGVAGTVTNKTAALTLSVNNTGTGNVVTGISIANDSNVIQVTKGSVDATGKEDVANKVTSLSASSTDTQYPSAKAVYDELQTKLGETEERVISASLNDLNSRLENVEDIVTFDSVPTGNSANLVTSGAVYQAIANMTQRKQMITYTASDTFVENLAWDTVHKFPEMTSLEFTIAAEPNDGYSHEITIIFDSGATATTLTYPTDVLWGRNVVLVPEANYRYEINIDDSNIAVFTEAALPVAEEQSGS